MVREPRLGACVVRGTATERHPCVVAEDLNGPEAPGNVALRKCDAVKLSQIVRVDKIDLEERGGGGAGWIVAFDCRRNFRQGAMQAAAGLSRS